MNPATAEKTVAFNDAEFVQDICCDYTREEIEAYWHQDHEFERMRRRDRTIAKRMSRGDCDRNYCTHGLISDDYRRQRRNRVRDAVHAVMTEQDTQRGESVDDAEAIADVYYEISYDDYVRANERGFTLAAQLAEGDKPQTVSDRIKNLNKLGGAVPTLFTAGPSACKSPGGMTVSPSKSAISRRMQLGSNERATLSIPRQL